MTDDALRPTLRLYVARSTPNSMRAQRNLDEALAARDPGWTAVTVEVIDVLMTPKRALSDGIIVTPTLIGTGLGVRQVLMGDLTDDAKLGALLQAVGLGVPATHS